MKNRMYVCYQIWKINKKRSFKANLWRADGGSGGPVPHEVRDARLRLLQPVDVHPRQLLREVIRQLRSEQFITLF